MAAKRVVIENPILRAEIDEAAWAALYAAKSHPFIIISRGASAMKCHQTEAMDVLKKNARFLKKEFGVKGIFLFGSFAKGKAGNQSDIDLIVDLEKPLGLKFIEMANFLEEALGRKVDIMTYRSFRRGFKESRYKHIADEINRSVIHVQP